MSANDNTAAEDAESSSTNKVPNSPSTAFAALSLHDHPSSSSSSPASTSSSIFTPAHLSEIESATALVSALDAARKQPKPLIRSTGHIVRSTAASSSSSHHHLLSWKVAEFAYRKTTSVGSELPTLARGLFTERLSSTSEKHRIVVRGYDKFFNLNELSWTKPQSISHYTTPPYVLTFKENGCIIFISSLSPTQLVVTSKHSLGSIDGTETTHAEKGYEWLRKHLAEAGRTEQELAKELWERNETAAFELCDDSFEEHVLAYDESRSGLHLHGLNSNAVKFSTRGMEEVDAFAAQWGFIRTRWLTLGSLEEVQKVTAEIEVTGAWEGEPIEGFVIRTHMPGKERMDELRRSEDKVVSPPYEPGQAWFYKVKFDEPYLMYRDWRELARKMVKEKAEWEAKVANLPSTSSSDPPSSIDDTPSTPVADADTPTTVTAPDNSDDTAPSKAALKRARKRLAKQDAKLTASHRLAAQSAGLLPPSPPQPRSKRPETTLFIQWCYDRLYGNDTIKPQPHLFAGLTQNKGIIAMRNAFLSYLHQSSPNQPNAPAEKEDTRPFTKTILAPIAVPGCGKTILGLALSHLFASGHVQSDDFKKKTGFLAALEKDLRSHSTDPNYVVFADKNNHLLQHRDDLIDLAARLSSPTASQPGKKSPPEVGRVRTIALAWELDSLPLNTLHRIFASRIEERGDNHQTLVADDAEGKLRGCRSHEVVLWKFLESLQPLGSSEGKGEGAEGYGDERFDKVVTLKVGARVEECLRKVVEEVGREVGWRMPSEEGLREAVRRAKEWKVKKKQGGGGAGGVGKKVAVPGAGGQEKDVEKTEQENKVVATPTPRYFGLAVELDVRQLLDRMLLQPTPNEAHDSIAHFYTTMRTSNRLNQRPHITLVHNSNLSSSTSTTSPNIHDDKWHFYTSLLQQPSSNDTLVFHITISTLLYEPSTLLTLPIDTITPPSAIAPDFQRLHYDHNGGETWTPHITLATKPDVPPYEANRVVATWRSRPQQTANDARGIQVLHLPLPITVEARIFGMS
ncbi:tRNA ligase [Pseudozyma hubeiensis]|nr:tRNA ligase [Pseudozyma hubeiensis]